LSRNAVDKKNRFLKNYIFDEMIFHADVPAYLDAG